MVLEYFYNTELVAIQSSHNWTVGAMLVCIGCGIPEEKHSRDA